MKRPRLWNDPTCKLPEDNYNQYSFSNATEKMNKIKKMLEMEDDHNNENNEKDPSEVILRKRDLKASQKGRLNIEKLIYEHEKKKLALEEVIKLKKNKNDTLSEIRNDIGRKMPPLEPSFDKKTHWIHFLSEMRWMANDFERERKDQKSIGKKLNRACKKYLDERRQLKIKQKKEELMEIKRKANHISKLVQKFWKN